MRKKVVADNKSLVFILVGLIIAFFAVGIWSVLKSSNNKERTSEPNAKQVAEQKDSSQNDEIIENNSKVQQNDYLLVSRLRKEIHTLDVIYNYEDNYEYYEGSGYVYSCKANWSGLPSYTAEFVFKKGLISYSVLYEDEEEICTGIYDYTFEDAVQIHYIFTDDREEGDLLLKYEKEGNRYSIEAIPNFTWSSFGSLFIPEQLAYINQVGYLLDLKFGYHDVTFDYEIDPSTDSLKSLRVTDNQSAKSDEFTFSYKFYTFNPAGVATLSQTQYADDETVYEETFDDLGVPLSKNNINDLIYNVDRFEMLTLGDIDFKSSSSDFLVGFKFDGDTDYSYYEEYEYDENYNLVTLTTYDGSGTAYEETCYSWQLADYYDRPVVSEFPFCITFINAP